MATLLTGHRAARRRLNLLRWLNIALLAINVAMIAGNLHTMAKLRETAMLLDAARALVMARDPVRPVPPFPLPRPDETRERETPPPCGQVLQPGESCSFQLRIAPRPDERGT